MQAIDLNLRILSTHRAQLAVLPRVGLHPVRGATRCRASTGPKSTLSGKSPVEQPARLWGRPGAVSSEPATSTSTQHRGGRPDGPDDDKPTWGVFDLARYGERWDVPWGAGRVAGGMALWFGSFVGVGFVLVPQLYRAAGVSLYDLPPEDKATFTLVCQAVETAVSLLLVRLLTAGPIARSGASEQQLGLFNFSPAAPFSKPRGWAFWGLCGVLASPAVVGGMASLLGAVGYEKAVGGQGTVDGVAGMIDLDLPTYLSLLAVTGVLAPILEETVFRGFLLTSLTRFMPTWAAVVASSGFFGLAHLSPRDLPVLSALGLLLGWSYVRSRNLLTPILIHGAWNSGVLTVLFWLASEGVDVQQLISDLREAAAAAS